LGGGDSRAPQAPRNWWGAEDSCWFQEEGLKNSSFKGYYLEKLAVPLDQFRIPPKELEEMLSQQLVMLKVAAEAIENARWNRARLLQTGVFIGLGLDLNTTNFHFRWFLLNEARKWNRELELNLSPEKLAEWIRQLRQAAGPPLNANRTMGALGGLVASRIAREFHIGGPSFTLSSEESSGLRAVAVAVQLLRQHELDQALVGAVDLAGDLRAVLAAHQARSFSQTDGTIIGEGAAAVVLKRLADAARDGDRIYAIIKGIGSANGGGIGSLVPDEQAYRTAMNRALTEADIDPEKTNGEFLADGQACPPGSIKGDFGHTGAASGLASLVKVSLCLHQKINLPMPNRAAGPRRAGVSSFSVDGNCLHVVLEEAESSSDDIATRQTDATDHWKEQSHEKDARSVVIAVGGQAFHIPEPPCATAVSAVARAAEQSTAETAVAPLPIPLESVIVQMQAAQAAKTSAHEAYLRFSQNLSRTYSDLLEYQMNILEVSPAERIRDQGSKIENRPERSHTGLPYLDPHSSILDPPCFDRPACLEFAVGSIGRVLGPDFAEIDSFPTRVRLPDEPLMLVDRILSVSGEFQSMQPGRVITEHDIHEGAWYLDGGRIPPCIAVEAGQADLFLSAFLGIDLQTRGLAVYRLLDAVVTFHDGLPGPGEVIRYDIRIERFFRHGDTWFFRFQFDGTVNGQLLLTMREGCAGFFTAAALAEGKGIVDRPFRRDPKGSAPTTDREEFVPMIVESYDDHQMECLRRGDLAGCFGPLFQNLNLGRPLPLPGGRMNLVHRVDLLDPRAGRYGLGLIRAAADIHPDDWFLTCHFSDDRVMPGTLMYECCLHTLRIYLMRMGWVGEQDETRWVSIPGVASRLKCRGQVIENTRKVIYEVSIKEVGYRPEPYALADALIYADGKPIVEITDMSLQLTGSKRDKVRDIWARKPPSSAKHAPPLYLPPASGRDTERGRKPAIFDHDRILAFAVGKPSEAFGERYKIFDEDRFIARLPGPPYQFLDRITAINAEPWQMRSGGVAEAQYDVPPDAWYFQANRQPHMPFAVLLEVALQSCGWLAAYMGSALASPMDLCFRNLGGTATQLAEVTPEAGTLTATVKITKVSNSAGMIIQNYQFAITNCDQPVYQGETYFGFFTRQALAQQVGIREANPYQPGKEELARGHKLELPSAPPFPDPRLRMIDRIDLYVPDGGAKGLGLIVGSKTIDPQEWFFQAHFYQDPVWPGSLGLEAFWQLLKVIAAEKWGVAPESIFEAVLGKSHRWLYRGEVSPRNRVVKVQAEITAVNEANHQIEADGFLSVDGRVIYKIGGFALRLK
jgi:3-hydroxymyristoyl/3-hydroxydecanoyl-(acyl carrier protein) dehydratase/3-oxoacyl-(acyl-carrier-protein) synthase